MRPTWAGRSPDCGAAAPRARSCWSASPWNGANRADWGAAGWRCSRMPRPTPCGCSSPITSRRAPPSSPTAGSPTARPLRAATSTSGGPSPAGRRTRRCRGVHRVASLAKRWLLGTHRGSADDAHLPGYLDEFVFRFNRRRSRSRGLVFYRVLELAVAHQPVRYRDLVLNSRTSTGPRQPPGTRGKPPTLDRPPARRPWRTADQVSSG